MKPHALAFLAVCLLVGCRPYQSIPDITYTVNFDPQSLADDVKLMEFTYLRGNGEPYPITEIEYPPHESGPLPQKILPLPWTIEVGGNVFTEPAVRVSVIALGGPIGNLRTVAGGGGEGVISDDGKSAVVRLTLK